MFGGTNWKVKKMSSHQGLIERLPSEYVGENVFIGASTMSKVELRRRYVNGIDALMWEPITHIGRLVAQHQAPPRDRL